MNQRGLTLMELMIAMIIGSIALLAFTIPFVAQRSFLVSGRRQTEAQRDAQIAFRSMALAAREGTSYLVNPTGSAITINYTFLGCNRQFQLGGAANSQLLLIDNCAVPAQVVTLIDGIRSRVTQLVFTPVTIRLVNIQLQVTHEGRENELLQTQLFLRNA